ncbi:MAG: sulfurtransferase-like selenium metabolism protein YedF [Eubacteriales bacterium]|nr:sulfurtransferase-like selenium metabolism protein YedF [Eubacteriales bacterium]
MIQVNAMGDTCPIPVIKTKQAIKSMTGADTVEVLVDNEIAVQNLTKMAKQKQYECRAEKISDDEYHVYITVGENEQAAAPQESIAAQEEVSCIPDGRKKNKVVVLRSGKMGEGSDELGTALMKNFIYALTELDELPGTILLYNGGAALSCEGSDSLEDLKLLEAQGVEIMTCGACLNYYGLTEKLAVGSVTNMYSIVETMAAADSIICP